jgi:negative regulator of flagellin synthesis FlgM
MDITKTGTMALYGQIQAERPENTKTGLQSAPRNVASPLGDTVTVSEEALLRTEAYHAALNAPDVRQDKVAALKARVESGAYVIDSRRIAADLLNSERDLLP